MTMNTSMSSSAVTSARAITTPSPSTGRGKKILDPALPQDEAKLRAISKALAGKGTVLLVVDQPSTIGAVPEVSAVAVAQAEGVMVGYIPGLAMRRIADLHPGEASTAAREAAIIAEAARSMSHTLRSIVFADEQAAEPSHDVWFR